MTREMDCGGRANFLMVLKLRPKFRGEGLLKIETKFLGGCNKNQGED